MVVVEEHHHETREEEPESELLRSHGCGKVG